MPQLKDRFRQILSAVSPAQRVVIAVAVGVFGIVAFVFYSWLTSPSYTILYANLDNTTLDNVITQLQTLKSAYQLDGNSVLVPMSDLYVDRAKLASAGVGGTAVPPGWSLFDNQSLTASSFTQQVDYQRALEGELDQTLNTLSGVQSATVNLAIPQSDQTLFSSSTPAPTASVVLTTTQTLSASEVDTVVFIVSSSVQGLTSNGVTVSDSNGTVLAAPGQGGSNAADTAQQAQTQSVEAQLQSEVQQLVTSDTGNPSSVVVHATLNFNQQTTQIQTYDPKTTVPATQSATTETLTGNPSAAAGIIGATGAQLGSTTSTATNYNQANSNTTFNAGEAVTSTTVAPGQIQQLSVGVVVGNAKKNGVAPDTTQISQLVSAALGLDPARGDSIDVTTAPMTAAAPAKAASTSGGLASMITQGVAAAVIVIVALFLLLMARGRRKSKGEPIEVTSITRSALPPGVTDAERRGPVRVGAGVGAISARQDVTDLVTRQPDEIAALLRSWLADRRTGE
jgi:flagellar M-ring protein FliF